jgi:uncharacterized RDD family membrane protein YckC
LNPTDVVARRVGATVIDGLVSSAITVGAWFAGTKSLDVSCDQVINGSAGVDIGGKCRGFIAGENGQTTFFLITVVASILLFWVLPAFTGYTPGKAAVGIKIIRRDGRNPGLWKVFVRGFMWIVDAFPYFIPYLTGFIVALNDKEEHKRIGDRVAGTLVVEKSAAGKPFAPPQQYGTSPQAFNAGPQQGYSPPPPPQQQQSAPAGGGPAPGWYDDPQREARLRYWDGSTWTSHTSA